MKTKKPNNPFNGLYTELKEEDRKFGGKRIKKAETDTHKKRQTNNLKKVWESHEEDWEEVDSFFGE